MIKSEDKYKRIPAHTTIAGWLQGYCRDIKFIDTELWFSFNGVRMHLCADEFTKCAIIVAEVFDANNTSDDSDDSLYSGSELTNMLNRNMYPYSFVWEDIDGTIAARKSFPFSISKGLEFIIKVEIYRMYYLCQQVGKVNYVGNFTDLPEDENWMQFLLCVIDKWVAADLLDINIMYLHGFASSGNSGTGMKIQQCLPKSKVVCPDLPIDPDEALSLIEQTVKENSIDLVVGTSMGGLFTILAPVSDKLVVNPSFHVSRMMFHRLDGKDSVVLPFFKKRGDGATKFELSSQTAEKYQTLEADALHNSSIVPERTIGLFGTGDDVVDCKEEFLTYFGNILHFKGGHRLDKEAIEEVVIPTILQMVINNCQQ